MLGFRQKAQAQEAALVSGHDDITGSLDKAENQTTITGILYSTDRDTEYIHAPWNCHMSRESV